MKKDTTLNIKVMANRIEEANHPFYAIGYTVQANGEEILNSVARFVSNKNGGKIQFLEPDM